MSDALDASNIRISPARIFIPLQLPKPNACGAAAARVELAVDKRYVLELRLLSPTGKTNPNLFRASRSARSMKGFLISLQCAKIQADTSDVLVTKL